ncbi:MAG: sigma-70 family RNA polymerase sigma factor [Lachnospiraceae bacterium]|nr:sigma-70 family RNA polymerase sigma factor [Lachnospiraceae bacterium]
MMKPIDDKKLIEFIKDNPDRGIHEAMQMYGRAVNTICRSILQGYDDGLVDEAVSETFFKLWKNSGQFSSQKGTSLKSWIYAVARNTAIDIRRKQGYTEILFNGEEEMEIVADISVEKEQEQRETKQLLHETIALLGEPDNQVFLCKYFLYMKNREIATQLQISEKKIENILYRGKTKLRELLIERGMTCYED